MKLVEIQSLKSWLSSYEVHDFSDDFVAGLVIATMLIPQAMAYAMLAGLPPQVGLYSSIVPLFIYAALGSSRVLAVGPVAIVSLMVATFTQSVALETGIDPTLIAVTFAFISGFILLIMGLLKMGFLANLLSHPVISSFTSAAAIIIALSQIKHITGIELPPNINNLEKVVYYLKNFEELHWWTLVISSTSILILIVFKQWIYNWLIKLGIKEIFATIFSRSGPLIVVILGSILIRVLTLMEDGVKIVGEIPSGLPSLSIPLFDLNILHDLLLGSALIALVGFVESFAIGKSLASRRRQRINANQELIALGSANIGASLTSGYPITGGFSRSAVNYAAGANSQMASIITACIIIITVLFFTPLFYYLPKSVLAAIIVIAVLPLFNLSSFIETWKFNKLEAYAWLITFISVLWFGIEKGIFIGIVLSILLYLWQISRPHIAIVGRIDGTEHYRNINRHNVITEPNILAIRVDENLFFANATYFENNLLSLISENDELRHIVLIFSSVNFIDSSALEILERLAVECKDAGITMHYAEINGPVMDKLVKTKLLELIAPGKVYLSTHQAMMALTNQSKN